MPDRAAVDDTVERPWVPIATLGFVIVALIALAAAPALLLLRVSRMADTVTTVILPADDGLRDFAFAMEQRIAAARSLFLTGDSIYAERLGSGIAAEAAALRTLEEMAPQLGPGAVGHVDALGRTVARRDSLEAALLRADAGLDAYRRALPQFDMLRDSMMLHLTALREQLKQATEIRVAEEARWAQRQLQLSALIGLVAVVAALIVGWFARLQFRLRRALQAALADAQQAHAEADERRRELERVTRSRERLMRGFTHDVKNPLGAARGYLELLGDGIMGPLTEKQEHSVRRAGASINAALTLVQDLLDLARAERGALDLRPGPTDLAALVHETAEEYRAQAETKGLSLRVDVPGSALVVTDEQRVRQVLGNLLSNAVKYTDSGEIRVRLHEGPDDGTQPRTRITVSDTGPGILPEYHERLFEEFVRIDSGNGRGPGAGIGLAISQRIARALDGEITVESEPGRGSSFTLWLPNARPSGGPGQS